MQSGLEIALAFNTINDKKSWSARAASRPESGIDVVHFNSKTGLVSLIYDTTDNRWQVKFNKFQAQWGDYIGSITRSFYSILNTLKAAGLPFEAPPTTEGIVIEATKGSGNIVYVRWPGDTPHIDPVMPEIRSVGMRAGLGVGYGGTLNQHLTQLRNSQSEIDQIDEALMSAGATRVQDEYIMPGRDARIDTGNGDDGPWDDGPWDDDEPEEK